MIADELERLQQLRESGALSEAEFADAKRLLLSGRAVGRSAFQYRPNSEIYGIKTNTWLMLMHLSQLLIFAGGLGFVAPIVMWAVSKDESEEADRHGLMILNWLLSSLLYFVISAVLSAILIGIPMLVALMVVAIVFPIMGAVKAGNGEYWAYPLTIAFFAAPRSSEVHTTFTDLR